MGPDITLFMQEKFEGTPYHLFTQEKRKELASDHRKNFQTVGLMYTPYDAGMFSFVKKSLEKLGDDIDDLDASYFYIDKHNAGEVMEKTTAEIERLSQSEMGESETIKLLNSFYDAVHKMSNDIGFAKHCMLVQIF